MTVGVPKEVKDHEARVGVVPSGVTALREAGHRVLVQTHAGEGSAITDDEYRAAGATIVMSAKDVWAEADMVVKVKEPERAEYQLFAAGPDPVHLSAPGAAAGIDFRHAGVANHGRRLRDHRGEGRQPAAADAMSEVAGRMSVQIGAQYLEAQNGGRGMLLSGIPGVAPANVVILGGGVVGTNAAKIALGMGAHVTVIDRNLHRLRELDDIFNGQVVTLASNVWTIGEALEACRPGGGRGADSRERRRPNWCAAP